MNISNFFLVLKARMKIVLLTFFITVMTAAVVSLMMPKVYKASTQIVLNYKGTDPLTGTVAPAAQLPGYMATQIDVVKNRGVALKVVDELGLAKDEGFKRQFAQEDREHGQIRDWLAGQLVGKLEVSPLQESSVLEIAFSGDDPDFVAAVANGFAKAYQNLSIQLKVEPAQKAADYFKQQVSVFRNNLEQAQTKLAKYRQEKGITSADERVDVESTRLNELSQQMVVAQAAAIEAKSRGRSATGNAGESPDVAINPVIQNLKVEAAKADSKLAELSQRLGTSHPQYEAAAAERNIIAAQLQNEIRRTSNSVANSAKIQQQRENELRSEVAQQKEKVLDLNRTRDELALLQKDVESAQQALDSVNQRFSQTSIEGQSNQSDIAILSLAQPPAFPSSPRIALNILLAIFLGGILGVGFGLIAEMMDRRVRSSNDVSNLLQVPVVALVNKKPTVTGLRLLPGQHGKFFPSA
jgi:protein tyrosine kinase modulator